MDGIVGFLPIVLIFIVFYFLMIKPAKKRQQQAAQTQNSLLPGAEVRTIAGLYATVHEVEDDTVVLEVAPGVYSRYMKSSIAAILSNEEVPDEVPVDSDEDVEAVEETADAPGKTVVVDKSDDAPVDLGKKADGESGDKPAQA